LVNLEKVAASPERKNELYQLALSQVGRNR
jgi:hypothetical protein